MNAARRLAWAVAAALLCGWLLIPKPDLYAGLPFSTLVTDREGRPLKLTPVEDGRYRLFTELEAIAPVARQATLLYEDRRFFSHPGVDPIALVRAAWTTYMQRSRVIGASTITMQLARLRFDMNTRTPLGKLAQAGRAIQLERHYGKAEILEAYLNLAPYGGNVEGIGTASRVYFNKPASALDLGEALALVVVPQNPTARFPGRAAGRTKLLAARERLLDAWRTYGQPLDTEGIARANLDPVFRPPSRLPSLAPHFVRDHVGFTGEAVIRTTLDLDLQTLLEDRIENHLARRRADGITNATAMLVDHRSMEVLALVGSAGFFDYAIAGQVNGARASRSPGSALKPLLYGLALDRGLIHPMTLLEDAPRRYAAYAPENFDRGFMGPVFARDALIHSRNVPAVTLLAKFGAERFRNWLEEAGVAGLRPAGDYGLALALGSGEATMEELVKLYAMLANRGLWRELVTAPDSGAPPPSLALQSPNSNAGKRLLSAEASFLVLDMLRDVPRPQASPLAAAQRHSVAWKTGTSFGFRDAWSIGVVGNHVLAVWTGNFDGSANPALVGREAAAPLFFAIADSLDRETTREVWWTAAETSGRLPERLNLKLVEVCATTGDLPGPHCPRTARSWFVPGVSPIRESTVYRKLRLDAGTGLRSCDPNAPGQEAVFEFWPSNLRAVFRRAGIAIRRPPPWSPECGLETTSASGHPPRIASPQRFLLYHHAPDPGNPARVPFSAVADDDAQALFWFVNDRFVARTAAGDDYFWEPRPGRFSVRVVDDLGRAAMVPIRVTRAPAAPRI